MQDNCCYPAFAVARRKHDVFISHAWEDKDAIARPLAHELQRRGFKVWFEESTLKPGDSLRRGIDQGLTNSRFGVVIVSQHFIAKQWTQCELDSLNARQLTNGQTSSCPYGTT